jgi:uncharacterized protein (DUF362 family)
VIDRVGVTTKSACTRRQWLAGAAAFCAARPAFGAATDAPTAPVSVARCRDYGAELLPTMQKMFDQLGGLGSLVRNKTVAIKVNLTGSPSQRLGYAALEDTHYTHPRVIGAAVHLLGRAGARRIRILESPWSTADPIEEYILQANWEPRDILNAAPNVEFENTNWLGNAKKYTRFRTPRGGHIYPGFDLNHSYEDCDVFVSIAKMKDHVTAGVTLSMKNCFGITPCTIYGEGAGVEEPSAIPHGGRGMFHDGNRQPAKPAPAENDPTTPRDGGYRVPRIVADLVAARPIHLGIVEGIRSMAGGEGPWCGPGLRQVSPGILAAGTNCVTTDAVSMALMDYDPMADRGTPPFETCDSTLRLAEELGVGTRDLRRIEVIGERISDVVLEYRKHRAARS